MEKDSFDGLAPLVIAFSGHRDLFEDDYEDITEAIGDNLVKICELYPNTPVVVLTGLAEGADRLAAEAVERIRKSGKHRLSYLPVLPMPRAYYEKDFASEASRGEFLRLIEGRDVVEIPLQEGNSPALMEDVRFAGRDRQYEALAAYLVRASQILLVVWDGDKTGKAGGTSDVVDRKLGKGEHQWDHPFRSMNDLGIGPVYCIYTRRKQNPHRTTEARDTVQLPEGAQEGDYHHLYALLDEYNRDVLTHPALRDKVKQSRESLTLEHGVSNPSVAEDWTAAVFSWSDVLAQHYQHMNLLIWRMVFVCIFVAGCGLHLLTAVMPARPFALQLAATLVYYFGLLGALLGWLIESGILHFNPSGKHPTKLNTSEMRGALKTRRKHEDYRALAEALRVQYFWLAAGIGAENLACERYLYKHRGEMLWVREAASTVLLYVSNSPAGDEGASRTLGSLWIDGQFDYFKRNVEHAEKRHRMIHTRGYILASLAFAAPAVRLALRALRVDSGPGFDVMLDQVPALAMFIAILGWNYAELMGFEQQSIQYRMMLDLYSRARQGLAHFQSEVLEAEALQDADAGEAVGRARKTMRKLLLELGENALAENGDWLGLHRGRDLKLNHGSLG